MDTQVRNEPIRLTSLSHGGGCGCKIAPAALTEILARMPGGFLDPALLVGTETSDDAAVYRLNDEQAIVATTDFFMPIVDDRATSAASPPPMRCPTFMPWVAGRCWRWPLSACRSTSCRSRPSRDLAGGAAVCAAAGIPVAGGHSIDSVEPIYGLAVLGVIHPDRVKRNSARRAGDVLILGKPLGVGILSAALKKGVLTEDGYGRCSPAPLSSTPSAACSPSCPAVHAMTDVTGFGLLGHLAEVCRGSNAGRVHRLRVRARYPGGLAAGSAGLYHRRSRSQLGELWSRGTAAAGSRSLAARAAVRSADQRWFAGRCRARGGLGSPGAVPARGFAARA